MKHSKWFYSTLHILKIWLPLSSTLWLYWGASCFRDCHESTQLMRGKNLCRNIWLISQQLSQLFSELVGIALFRSDLFENNFCTLYAVVYCEGSWAALEKFSSQLFNIFCFCEMAYKFWKYCFILNWWFVRSVLLINRYRFSHIRDVGWSIIIALDSKKSLHLWHP